MVSIIFMLLTSYVILFFMEFAVIVLSYLQILFQTNFKIILILDFIIILQYAIIITFIVILISIFIDYMNVIARTY